jgi:hypothetical protein
VPSLPRLLRSLLTPARLVEVRSPHGGIVVVDASVEAGGVARAAVMVKARGTGIIGRGVDAVTVDGDFDGVVFGTVDTARNLCVLEYGGLLRRRRHTLPVTIVTMPTTPPAPTPLPAPSISLPLFVVSVEVP